MDSKMNYFIRGIDPQWWRLVRSTAALRGITVREMILKALEKEVGEKTITPLVQQDHH